MVGYFPVEKIAFTDRGTIERNPMPRNSRILADHPAPTETPIYYFEVEILDAPQDAHMIVSFEYIFDVDDSTFGSWGWEIKEGKGNVLPERTVTPVPPEYLQGFNKGDVVGCGFEFDSEIIFFTKNGHRLGKSSFLSSHPLPS